MRRGVQGVTGLLGILAFFATAGCGSESAGPPIGAPVAAEVSEGSRGSGPFEPPPCRVPRNDDEIASAAVRQAAEKIRAAGEKKYPARYAGVVACAPEDRVFVYRLTGGSAAQNAKVKDFERAIRTLAREAKVDVAFEDGRFNHRVAERTRRAVLSEFARLERAGAPFAMLALQADGTVEVGVRGNVAAAEQVLASMLDRVHVVLVPEPPSATPAPSAG